MCKQRGPGFRLAGVDWLPLPSLFQMKLERAEWGSDLPSVESQLDVQRHIHTSVEDLGASVKEARMYEVSRELDARPRFPNK